MASHSTGHSSGANASQDGLSNIRMIVRRIFEWGSIGIAIIVVVVWIKFFPPWEGLVTTPSSPGIAVTTAQTTNGPCDYAHRRLELSTASVVFNPGARCIFHFTVAEGPIEFDGPQGSVVLEAGEKRDLSQMWFESAKALNGHAVLLYQLVE